MSSSSSSDSDSDSRNGSVSENEENASDDSARADSASDDSTSENSTSDNDDDVSASENSNSSSDSTTAKPSKNTTLADLVAKQEHDSSFIRNKRARQQTARELALQRLADYRNKKQKSEYSEKTIKTTSDAEIKPKSKNAPTEAFGNHTRRRYHDAGTIDVTANLFKPRDPRIDNNNSTTTNPIKFAQNYAFLNNTRRKEMTKLKERIKKQKKKSLGDSSDSQLQKYREELQLLQRQEAFIKNNSNKTLQQQEDRTVFMKKRDIKSLQAEQKFEELQAKGGERAVQKAIEKKRRKNKAQNIFS